MTLSPYRLHIRDVDPVLHGATAHLSPTFPLAPQDPATALVRAIIGQQLSARAANTIWYRLRDRLGGEPIDPQLALEASEQELRDVGLSGRKVSYVKSVAEAAATGYLDRQRLDGLDDPALERHLVALRGIGPWTAQMLMMFGLERPDVFSPGDLVLQQAMAEIYSLPEEGRALLVRMEEIARRWSPWRTFGCQLLWAYREGS